MTWYPSAENSHRIYREACEKLNSLRGQQLTQKKIFELFGHFNESGDSTDDERSAFRRAIKEDWIIEESPKKFRVAIFNKKEAEEKTVVQRENMQKLMAKTAEQVRDILLPSLRARKERFPRMEIGSGDHKKRLVRALIIHNAHPWVVILSPDGIFECYASLSVPDKKYWYTNPMLWIKYGEESLIKIMTL